jgi:hypothetical protein
MHISFIARGVTLMWKYPALEAQADLSDRRAAA